MRQFDDPSEKGGCSSTYRCREGSERGTAGDGSPARRRRETEEESQHQASSIEHRI
jgi:hypothetical protein